MKYNKTQYKIQTLLYSATSGQSRAGHLPPPVQLLVNAND